MHWRTKEVRRRETDRERRRRPGTGAGRGLRSAHGQVRRKYGTMMGETSVTIADINDTAQYLSA